MKTVVPWMEAVPTRVMIRREVARFAPGAIQAMIRPGFSARSTVDGRDGTSDSGEHA